MRSEKEMYELILGYAEKNDDIRAVILNGSRANPARVPDPFNDFDIVYLVRDAAPYKSTPLNIEYGEKLFGKMLVFERTDDNELFGDDIPDTVCYLMQFADGNRIDLTIADIKRYEAYCFDDRLSVVLLDKDEIIPKLLPADESSHFITPPNERTFSECRTEFWWVAPYVSKGLWHGQLLFAYKHLGIIREMHLQMLKWYAGAIHGFDLSVGKAGDRLAKLLPEELWRDYLSTFAICDERDIWRALFSACDGFSRLSVITAEKFGFCITDSYDKEVPKFLRYTESLPRDAATIDFNIEN